MLRSGGANLISAGFFSKHDFFFFTVVSVVAQKHTERTRLNFISQLTRALYKLLYVNESVLEETRFVISSE